MKLTRPKEGDAFGLALWYAHNKAKIGEIVENDKGYIFTNDIGRYFAPHAKWSQNEKQAIAHMKGAVLDIGCGAGRHSLYAQERGHTVTAIDSSQLAIDVTKLRGVRDAQCLPIARVLELGDARYDTVLLLGCNIGLLGNRSRGKKILKLLHKVTAPEAIIIGESIDPKNIDESILQNEGKRGVLRGQLRIRVRCSNLATAWMGYCYLALSELADITQGTGWVVREHIAHGKRDYAVILAKKN